MLANGRRALVVMGDGHVSRMDLHGRPMENAVALVERKHPGSVFAVLTYLGRYRASTVIEDRLARRNTAAADSVSGTSLGALSNVPPRPPTRRRVGGRQVSSETVEIVNPRPLAHSGDAMLYLAESNANSFPSDTGSVQRGGVA